jgi:hypothetical protein
LETFCQGKSRCTSANATHEPEPYLAKFHFFYNPLSLLPLLSLHDIQKSSKREYKIASTSTSSSIAAEGAPRTFNLLFDDRLNDVILEILLGSSLSSSPSLFAAAAL